MFGGDYRVYSCTKMFSVIDTDVTRMYSPARLALVSRRCRLLPLIYYCIHDDTIRHAVPAVMHILDVSQPGRYTTLFDPAPLDWPRHERSATRHHAMMRCSRWTLERLASWVMQAHA